MSIYQPLRRLRKINSGCICRKYGPLYIYKAVKDVQSVRNRPVVYGTYKFQNISIA